MKSKLLVAAFSTLLLSGCGAIGNGAGSDGAATFDRDKAIKELNSEINKVGVARQEIIPGIDGFLNTAASLLERQQSNMQEFRKVADNHRDVQAFLLGNRANAKDPQKLQAAIDAFDASATKDSEKIGPKIKAYKGATSSIQEANTKMAKEIAVELAQSTYILSQHSSEVAAATTVGLTSGFLNKSLGGLGNALGSSDGNNSASDELDPADVGQALLRAKKQLDLAIKANRLIGMDRKTIAAIEQLEKELAAK